MTQREEFEKWFANHPAAQKVIRLIGHNKIINNLCHDAWKASKATPVLPQWIPVSERLPEYGIPVLLVVDVAVKPTLFKRVKFEHEWWESIVGAPSFTPAAIFYINDADYWMPLPSAPEQSK